MGFRRTRTVTCLGLMMLALAVSVGVSVRQTPIALGFDDTIRFWDDAVELVHDPAAGKELRQLATVISRLDSDIRAGQKNRIIERDILLEQAQRTRRSVGGGVWGAYYGMPSTGVSAIPGGT